MAYDATKPPMLLSHNIGSKGPSIWILQGTDTGATVQVTGYITNGGVLGMKVGDAVLYLKTDAANGGIYFYQVISVATTGNGAVDLSDAVTLASANSN